MSDITSSDAPTPGVETSETSGSSAASPSIASPNLQVSPFGTARGSGLARGKRPAAASVGAPSTAPSDYRPTAIEVITPASDYKNPFAEPAPAAPAIEAKPPTAAAGPTPTASVQPKEIPAASAMSSKPAAKPQINILPPEQPKHNALSWESGSDNPPAEARQRRDERPVFRPERREQKTFEPREPRREPPVRSAELPFRPAVEAAPKKSGGFFGWVKMLFGGKKPEGETLNGKHGMDEHRHQHRRRHRGGRGRGGFRDGQPQPGGGSGERRFEGGHRFEGGRRRRRGGRNHHHRGGQGGPPRGESGPRSS